MIWGCTNCDKPLDIPGAPLVLKVFCNACCELPAIKAHLEDAARKGYRITEHGEARPGL